MTREPVNGVGAVFRVIPTGLGVRRIAPEVGVMGAGSWGGRGAATSLWRR